MDVALFNAGIRPAINAGLSVSRVGGAAQTKIIKKLVGTLRISLAQYRELEAFAQFASDLDEATRKQLERGQRIMEILKQPQYLPLSVAEMAVVWYVTDKGYLDDVDLKRVSDFENALLSYLRDQQSALLTEINANPVLTDEIVNKIKAVIEEFKNTQAY